MESTDYDWPGWRLQDNPWGEEFDLDARKRMVEGSRKILPVLQRWSHNLGDRILEAGPFFNPVVTPTDFPDQKISYWDNDHYVLNFLAARYPETKISYCDVAKIKSGIRPIKNAPEINHNSNHTIIKRGEIEKVKAIALDYLFTTIVASHILNYIDYRSFLNEVKNFLKPGGLLCINNSIDYGLSPFFSPLRPRSNEEIVRELQQQKFSILEKEEIATEDTVHQPHNRLLLVARK